MKLTSWMRCVPLAMTLSVLAADADTRPPSYDGPANAILLTQVSESANNAPTVVYTDLPPVVVRPRRIGSPKAMALRLRVVSGRTADRLDRGPMRESPRAAAMRERREAGVTLDRLNRELMALSPRAEVNFPTP